MQIYIVQPNDTIDLIADATRVSADQIALDNQLIYPYELAIGQALLILDGERNPDRSVQVSGYAYPFISRWVLEQTLPYLSELPIFSYGFTSYGEMIPPEIDETWMIEAAKREGTEPVLTLTPLGPDGRFNNNLINSVVNNPAYTENLIRNLLEVMAQKHFGDMSRVD